MGALFGSILSTVVGEVIKGKLGGKAPRKGTPGKGLIHSKTVWGVVAMALPVVASWFGWGWLDEVLANEIIGQLSVLFGGVLAIYGRIKAKVPIGQAK